MATRAESLIRQFCAARTTEVQDETKAAQNKIPHYIRVRDLPLDVRSQLHALHKAQDLVSRLRTALVAKGYAEYELSRRTSKLSHPERGDRQIALNKRRTERLHRINQIRDQAYIDVMGKTPAASAGIVERVRKDLAKV